MSCPTCDHTMQRISDSQPGEIPAVRWFWCPRCGTLKHESGGHTDIDQPNLVDHCRRLISHSESMATLTMKPVRFEIHENDAGTEAYQDGYVDRMRSSAKILSHLTLALKESVL